MRILKVISIVLLLGQGLTVNAQSNSFTGAEAALNNRIDSILGNQVKQKLIPGAVILIKVKNRTIIHKAYGYAKIYDRAFGPLRKPVLMTTGHLFDIASLTKVVGTTSSIMLLADRKQISIDDAVGKYIPAFRSEEKRAITIRHLLSHSSGMNEWYPMYYRSANRQDSYSLIGSLPLKFPIGAQRRYSDLGFTVLGQIIEVVSGRPMEQFMRQELFSPLGMKHTTYNPLRSGRFKKIASTSFGNPYEKRMVHDSSLGFRMAEIDPDSWKGWRNYTLNGEVNDGNAWYANDGVSGAAGLFSTASDIQAVVDLLMQKGKHRGRRILGEETIRAFLRKDSLQNGLGWMMDPSNSFMKNAPEGSFGHTGFTGTSIAVIPSYNASVILLINRQHTGLNEKGEYYNLNPVRAQVFQALLDYCRSAE